MMDFDRPSPKIRRRVRSLARSRVRLVLAFVSCVLVVNSLAGEKGLIETMRARRHYQELVASIHELRAQNARLRDEARRLREDPDTIEAIARRELGLVKPGELVFIVKDVPAVKDIEESPIGSDTP